MFESFTIKREQQSVKASRVSTTEELFAKGLNCAQAIAAAYGPQFGLDREQALKVAGAFGSGMGMGGTCGAVTGALMIIGLKYAKVDGIKFISRDKTYELGAGFIGKFKSRNKTASCKELLGCDLSTAEGRRQARKENHFKKRCPKFVHDAAEILEEMMKE